MLKTERQVLAESGTESIRSLYNKYAGMLLGYIFEIVKDRKLAEECLLQIFCELSEEFGDENAEGPQNWSQLQRFAMRKLKVLTAVPRMGVAEGLAMRNSDDQQLAKFSAEQKRVFVDIYYHGKAVVILAAELNRTEEFIRKTLKEAFAILRKSGEN